ncbi:S8 family serine peptidase [Chryseosolibacter indicus]|uniref:S8 family serine peptidase n=1 Tax=Chryseosolibacter indicus TaxID=2782351 RepID=A0ABS5VPU9_9BACT|nr:S8 family serine peptidase [Chryseosolibacter indicus]MBT1703472.1 S8 family serine peptidase [Chryseosolibacter indicus]
MVGNRKALLGLILLLITEVGWAQINRYMVFFKDKNGSPFSTTNPDQFLSQKAITRRIKQGVTITEQDLPVNSNYISGVQQAGAEVFFKSKWFNAVLVQCDASLTSTLFQLPYVSNVEFVAPQAQLISRGRKKFSLRKNNTPNGGAQTAAQLNLIGIPEMHQMGKKGEGMVIAVFDAGFPGVNNTAPFSHLFEKGKINAGFDFVYNTTDVFRYDAHGTEVLSVIAADVPDAFTGGAPEATFQLYVTEDDPTEYRIEEYNWAFAAEHADSSGVDIINSSLGYYDFDIPSMNYTKAQMDGKTAVITKAAQWASDRGMLVVCSAGNEGNIASWRIITAPADAEGVLAVASVNAEGVRSSSSSIGPAADGRVKPDVAAMGVGVRVINERGSLSSVSGTSLSAPLITALVAGVWQTYPDLTSKEIMQLIKETASQAKNPDNFLGYGIPNYKAIVNFKDQFVQERTFEVFPNPTNDTIVISPIDPDSITTCQVELISALGQIIAKEQINFSWLNRNYKADLSSLSAGLYYVRILYADRRYIFRVVKE